jgi:Bifunctional DNA primase/polymerase, N-terminal
MARDFNRDWALRLCEAHIAIFPCNEKKRPLIDRWPEFSSCDPDVVAQWWAKHPGALPAIDLAKCDLFVLDGDRHGGPDGRAALRRLLLEEGFNRETAPAALTPADGRTARSSATHAAICRPVSMHEAMAVTRSVLTLCSRMVAGTSPSPARRI